MVHGGEIYDKDIEYDFSVNLNPKPCPEEVISALERAVGEVQRYPDITAGKFREMVSRAENRLSGGEYICADNVIGGNGASELIMAIIRMIMPKNVLIPVPCFSGYEHGLGQLQGVKVREFYLKEENDFELTESFADEIDDDTDMVILANPNNPTGRAVDERVLEKIAERCKETGTSLMVDECFLHLSDRAASMVRYIDRMPGLFIVGAYTKLFSIPGVRVGYAMSGRDNIRKLTGFLPEWNMSVFAQYSGLECARQILDTTFVMESKDVVRKERRELSDFLRSLGMKVYPSDSCFVLVKSGKDIYNSLLKKKILIRDCSNFRGLGSGYYRISVSGSDVLRNPGLWADTSTRRRSG